MKKIFLFYIAFIAFIAFSFELVIYLFLISEYNHIKTPELYMKPIEVKLTLKENVGKYFRYKDLLINRSLLKGNKKMKKVSNDLIILPSLIGIKKSKIFKFHKEMKFMDKYYNFSLDDYFLLVSYVSKFTPQDLRFFSSLDNKIKTVFSLELKRLFLGFTEVKLIRTNKYNCIIYNYDFMTVIVLEVYSLNNLYKYKIIVKKKNKAMIEKILQNIRFKDNP